MNANAPPLASENVNALPLPRSAKKDGAVSRTAQPEQLQRNGKLLTIAGTVVTIIGVVLYCIACFAGGVSEDLGAILLDNVAPFARGTLAVLGLGTVMWLAGSVMYIKGTMDAEGPSDLGSEDAPRKQ